MYVFYDTLYYLSQENQKKLFNQVIQFNPGKLQNGQGSGLGLYSKIDINIITYNLS